MTAHAWKVPMTPIGIGDVDSTEEIAMAKELYNDLLQVLREADADLAGIYNRWDLRLFPQDEDAEAAQETREHLNQVYETLTGQPVEQAFD